MRNPMESWNEDNFDKKRVMNDQFLTIYYTFTL